MSSTIDPNRLTTFVYKDLGLDRIKHELHTLSNGAVFVGWPGRRQIHQPVNHLRGSIGGVRARPRPQAPLDVAVLAVIHEYGSPQKRIPARPVMQQTNKKHAAELQLITAGLVQRIYEARILPTKALAQLGAFWEGQIKQTFRDGVFKALRPATIARKGSSTPLIDSGQLRQSVTSVVRWRS